MANIITLEEGDVKLLEHVDARVSDKYVPIFTSELMKLLKPEFEFVDGSRISKTSTAHYINLKNKNDDTIRIYNSFDRSMALRIGMVSEGISIPLGIDRLIHIGQKARDFQEEFKEAKADILEAVTTAKAFKEYLEKTVATADIAKAITTSIFTHGAGKKQNLGISEFINYTDLLLDKNISLKKYINLSIRSYQLGEYSYVKDGVKMNGRPKPSLMGRIHLENRLIKTLQEKFPEYFL